MKPLFRPVKPFVLNQKFGENNACIPINGGPVITCNGLKPPKGYKSLYGPKGHKGIDLRAFHNQPIYCALDGVVGKIDTDPKSGLDVGVVSDWNGKTYMHVYEHLLGYQPKVGDKVKSGDLIGWADNTGYSSGDHLHFELKELRGKTWVSIDPMPLMSEYHAQDIRTLTETIARIADLVADLLRKKK